MEGTTYTTVDTKEKNCMITFAKKDWEEIRLNLTSLSRTNEEIAKGNKFLPK